MNLPQSSLGDETASSQTPKTALLFMVVIIVVMALTALYANVQRWRRPKIEAVAITPASSPSVTPRPQKHFRGTQQ